MEQLTNEKFLQIIERKFSREAQNTSLLELASDALVGYVREETGDVHYSWPFSNNILIVRKDDLLLQHILLFLERKQWPLVDKHFGLIIGVPSGAHEAVRAFLFACHHCFSYEEFLCDWAHLAALYMRSGCGYYISSMRPTTIVRSPGYRPDRFDRDVSLNFTHSYNA